MKKSILYRFFDNIATAEEQESIRAWIEAAPENTKQLLKERRLYDSLIFNGSLQREANVLSPLKKSLGIALKIAALFVLVLSIALLTKNTFLPQSDLTAKQTILVPTAQRVQLILPDSTVVWLNSNTTFEYPLQFAEDVRKVHLDGEGYFEVSKNSKRPFIVSTSKGDIRVTGTSFNVEAYSKRNSFETALMEGSVLVSSKSNPGRIMKLRPHQKSVLQAGKLERRKITTYDPYLWRKGLIAFKNKTLREIFTQFEKYYDIEIVLSKDFVVEHTYTGKFRQADGIDYALQVLQKSICFNYNRDDEEQIIYVNNSR